MLDFTHLREITDTMKGTSLAYAECFWQKVFDAIPLNEKKSISNWIFVGRPGCWGIDLEVPHEADVLNYFDKIKLQIGFSYAGDINVYFHYEDDEIETTPYHTILTDALLANGFIQTDNEGLCFKRNINKN